MVSYSPLLLFSSLTIITAGLVSFVFFRLSFKEKYIPYRSSLRQWSLAFFLFTWVRMPTVLAAAGVEFVVPALAPFYAVAFIAFVIAYLLFYRGVAISITTSKFWLNKFPILVFIFFNATVFLLNFVARTQTVNLIAITKIFSYVVIAFMFAAAFKLLRKRGYHMSSGAERIGMILVSVGWALYLAADIAVWLKVMAYPIDFWFTALISTTYAYIGLSIAHILILIGFVLWSYHKNE